MHMGVPARPLTRPPARHLKLRPTSSHQPHRKAPADPTHGALWRTGALGHGSSGLGTGFHRRSPRREHRRRKPHCMQPVKGFHTGHACPIQKFSSDSERIASVILENKQDDLKWVKPARASPRFTTTSSGRRVPRTRKHSSVAPLSPASILRNLPGVAPQAPYQIAAWLDPFVEPPS